MVTAVLTWVLRPGIFLLNKSIRMDLGSERRRILDRMLPLHRKRVQLEIPTALREGLKNRPDLVTPGAPSRRTSDLDGFTLPAYFPTMRRPVLKVLSLVWVAACSLGAIVDVAWGDSPRLYTNLDLEKYGAPSSERGVPAVREEDEWDRIWEFLDRSYERLDAERSYDLERARIRSSEVQDAAAQRPRYVAPYRGGYGFWPSFPYRHAKGLSAPRALFPRAEDGRDSAHDRSLSRWPGERRARARSAGLRLPAGHREKMR